MNSIGQIKEYRSKTSITTSSYKGSQAIILVFDITKRDSLNECLMFINFQKKDFFRILT